MRGPRKRRRQGAAAFLAVMMVIVVGGLAAIVYSRSNPPPLTRGASAGEHWHAKLTFFICGKRMNPYPSVEGEIHSHGDGFMHIHPRSPTHTGDNANINSFLLLYETSIVDSPEGETTLTFPDGQTYKDGDRCPKAKERYDIEATNKGKPIEGDIGAFLPHDGDVVEIKFGPKGDKPMPNPYAKSKGLPDPGSVVRRTPAPDTAPEPAPVAPGGEEPGSPEATPG